ncbi:Slp family lipoprotein [Marinobacterium sediminicola]|uniref:Outer membrane lipoprotein n=1 Tax=Marinobacterium sediminicola TaxID=518898 RepID=A0ABY1RYS8_9GAMM|nr:Slp family lipoprotein [Marinobacterium sediminicola]ULG68036.1 Slp family lipoprotein [Marinobacterium sediminicola]SMR73454.1 outer membrane lipoprotein [Marinobacterium sediminicola]
MWNRCGVLILLLMLGGCASLPDELRPINEQALLPFSEALHMSPPAEARWGGEIASVRNQPDGSVVEVVQFALNTSGRPLKSDISTGRFRIRIPGFIDPAIYAPGRLVTALGRFTAIEQDKVGEQPYAFPVLETGTIHLWPEIKDPPERCDCDPFLHSPFMMRPIILVPNRN